MKSAHVQKATGTSLIIGSLLMTLTMTFHPTGGSFEAIVLHAPISIATHGLAIVAAPFAIFGFWGLSSILQANNEYAALALILASLGFFGAMVAAAINGITLPTYVLSFGNELEYVEEQIRPIVRYGSFLNRSMDYVFIGGVVGAILLLSGINYRHRPFPCWISYLGLLIGITVLLIPFLVSITSLNGFRVVVFGMVMWTTAMGIYMRRKQGSV